MRSSVWHNPAAKRCHKPGTGIASWVRALVFAGVCIRCSVSQGPGQITLAPGSSTATAPGTVSLDASAGGVDPSIHGTTEPQISTTLGNLSGEQTLATSLTGSLSVASSIPSSSNALLSADTSTSGSQQTTGAILETVSSSASIATTSSVTSSADGTTNPATPSNAPDPSSHQSTRTISTTLSPSHVSTSSTRAMPASTRSSPSTGASSSMRVTHTSPPTHGTTATLPGSVEASSAQTSQGPGLSTSVVSSTHMTPTAFAETTTTAADGTSVLSSPSPSQPTPSIATQATRLTTTAITQPTTLTGTRLTTDMPQHTTYRPVTQATSSLTVSTLHLQVTLGSDTGVQTAQPIPHRTTRQSSTTTTKSKMYSDEATLIILLTAVCSLTGVAVLLLLVYLIYKQNGKWKRQRTAGTRRTLGAVNQGFFNADMALEEEQREQQERVQGFNEEQVADVLVRRGPHFDQEEFDSGNPTSEYSSSIDSVSAPLNTLGDTLCPEGVTAAAGTVPGTTHRWRSTTNDSGYDQGAKDDTGEAATLRFQAAPNQPIATQMVYTNIDPESDFDGEVDSATQEAKHRRPKEPIAFVESSPKPGTNGGVNESNQMSTQHADFHCRPVVNAEGIVVRHARFPSKTSSQLSASDHDSDRLLANSSH
eukprot:scpid8321/ scgid4314/ 